MRDTAQLGPLAAYLTANLVPRDSRTRLFRSWASMLAMLPVGGPKAGVGLSNDHPEWLFGSRIIS
jgi:hypothetical protein